jgi:hypothetical protein
MRIVMLAPLLAEMLALEFWTPILYGISKIQFACKSSFLLACCFACLLTVLACLTACLLDLHASWFVMLLA